MGTKVKVVRRGEAFFGFLLFFHTCSYYVIYGAWLPLFLWPPLVCLALLRLLYNIYSPPAHLTSTALSPRHPSNLRAQTMLPRAHLSPSLLRCTGGTATHIVPRPATRGLVDTAPATGLAELARQASKRLTSRSDAAASLEQSAQPTTSIDKAPKTAQSLGQQGRADLAVDLSSLSSGLDYRRRLRTKAPHLKINSSSKNSLDVAESKVGQKAHRKLRLSLKTSADHNRSQKSDAGSDKSVTSVDHENERPDFGLPTGSDGSEGKLAGKLPYLPLEYVCSFVSSARCLL